MTTQKSKNNRLFKLILCLIAVLLLIIATMTVWILKANNTDAVISREGVVSQIQTMSRLQTVAFSVDTVVTANKQGSWQNLWQDKQKGLFIIKGRVLAGVDLSQIGDERVQLIQTTDDNGKTVNQLHISLPPAQVFEVFLDNIEVYDWQTGLLGAVSGDPALFAQAQDSAKAQILAKACQGDVLNLAMQNAAEQVKGLFALADLQVMVSSQGTAACQLSSS